MPDSRRAAKSVTSNLIGTLGAYHLCPYRFCGTGLSDQLTPSKFAKEYRTPAASAN